MFQAAFKALLASALAASLLASCAGLPGAGAAAGVAETGAAAGAAETAQPTGSPRAANGHSLVGEFRYHQLRSDFLPDDRTLVVYLPPAYGRDPSRRFPVVYLHDGNNVFDRATAFLGREWQVDETAQRLIEAGRIHDIVIVGVYNTPARIFEYTWVPRQGDPPGGGGERYGRLLAEEVKPFVDRTYRTLSGRKDTAVMGSSLGGLVSFYLGRHRGDLFGAVGLVSPSIWWAERAALREVPSLRRDLRIWLDMGTKEGDDPAAGLANARAMRDALIARGYAPGSDLGYFEDVGGTHDEDAWARRVHRPLEFFFGTAR